MNILFVCQNFYPTVDATPSIVRKIAQYCISKGDTVSVLNARANLEDKSEFVEDGMKIYTISKYVTKQTLKQTLKEMPFCGKLATIGMTASYIAQQKLKVSADKLHLEKASCFHTTYELKRLLKKEKFDAVVSVSYPFDMHWATYEAVKNLKNIKFYTYSLDPFFSNVFKQDIKDYAITLEEKVLQRVDKAICLDLIAKDYKGTVLEKYLFKVEVLEFPTIIAKELNPQSNDIVFDDKYINLVFLGYFYPDIRNPKTLLDMMCEPAMSGVRLNVIGGSYGEFPEGFWDGYKQKLGDRLVFHGIVDQTRAVNAMLNSDILVNFGNSIPNQLPSKIFEYISTGKSVLNIYQIEKCPTLKYFNRYDMCHNFYDRGNYSDIEITELVDFCNKNSNKIINFSQIRSKFKDCTPDVVMKKIRDIINN